MRIFDNKKERELQLSELDLERGRLFSDKLVIQEDDENAHVEHILVYRRNDLGKKHAEIVLLKRKLCDTDYKAIKYAEGKYTKEEYAPIDAQREAWRARINELEQELKGAEEV